MSQGHMDRLSSIDASFLTNESDASHMHVGAVLIFEGPPPKYVDLVEHIRGRLALVPRFRQRLVVLPLEAGRPLWADDVNFNLTYHIRHTALPEPGGEAQLKRLAGRVFSQQLDRSKPLWELWLVQGLERDRFAILTKTHHAMVDGVSGVDIGTVLFDLTPMTAAFALARLSTLGIKQGWAIGARFPRFADALALARADLDHLTRLLVDDLHLAQRAQAAGAVGGIGERAELGAGELHQVRSRRHRAVLAARLRAAARGRGGKRDRAEGGDARAHVSPGLRRSAPARSARAPLR